MINALLFEMLARQSAVPQTTPEWVYFAIVTALSILLGGGVLAAMLKNWTDDQALKNEQARAKMKADAEESKASVQQDTALSETLSELAHVLKTSVDNQGRTAQTAEERNRLQAKHAELLALQNQAMDTMIKSMATLLTDVQQGRLKIITEVTDKVDEAKRDVDEHRRESAQWVLDIHNELAQLKKDFDAQIKAVLDELSDAPTTSGKVSAARQILDAINGVGKHLEEIEKRLPPPPEAPKPDGPAEIKPPQETPVQ